MDTRSSNPLEADNPTRDLDGSDNIEQAAQPHVAIDISHPDAYLRTSPSSNTVEALAVAENPPHNVISNSDTTQVTVQSSSGADQVAEDPTAFPLGNDTSRQEEQSAATPTRIYFKPKEGTSTEFDGGTNVEPAIRVEASKPTKLVWKDKVQEGLHNVRMSVNLENIKIDKIQTLSITQYDGDALEILTGDELQKVVDKSKSKLVTLGLHRQYLRGDHRQYLRGDDQQYLRGKATEEVATFTMELRTFDYLSQDDAGYIGLEFIEMYPSHSSPVANDVNGEESPLTVWVFGDIKGEPTDTATRKRSGVIISYSLSRDGNYVATLSTDDKYDMAWLLERAKEQLSIAVSNDASMVILMCGMGKDYKEPLLENTFQAFNFKTTTSTTAKNTPPGGSGDRRLSPLKNMELTHTSNHFRGFGKFHFVDDRDSWMQRYITGRGGCVERFIRCDETNVEIYSIGKKWKPILSIIHSSSTCPTATIPRNIIDGIGGNGISWIGEDNILKVCSLNTGDIVHAMTFEGTAILSKDGSLMAYIQTSKLIDNISGTTNTASGTIRDTPETIKTTSITITTRWIGSRAIIATTDVEVDAESRLSLGFIESGRRIMISSVKPDNDFGQGIQGMILDTTTLSLVERVSYPTKFSVQQPQSIGKNGELLISQHGSKLDFIMLQDIVVVPHHQPRYQCNTKCLVELTEIQESDLICPLSDTNPILIPSTGLKITVKFEHVLDAEYAIVVSTSNRQGEILRIPPLKIKGRCFECKIHVDPVSNHLIAYCRLLVMVWKLPTRVSSSFILHTVLCTQPVLDKSKFKEVEPRSIELMKCRHGNAYTVFQESKEKSTSPLYGNRACDHGSPQFLAGLFVLISAFPKGKDDIRKGKDAIRNRGDTIYDGDDAIHNRVDPTRDGDRAFQQAVLKFVGLYINKPLNHLSTTLNVICDYVGEINYDGIYNFLEELSGSSHVQWIPKPGANGIWNPIYCLFHGKNLSNDKITSLTRIMIDHCLRVADDDWHFLSPILDSLKMIVYHQKSFPDLIPKILWKMAFLPVKDISHGVISQPSGLQQPPRQHGMPIINRSDKPILQLSRFPLSKEHYHQIKHVPQDVCVAPFDILWGLPRNERSDFQQLNLFGLVATLGKSLAIFGYSSVYLAALAINLVSELVMFLLMTVIGTIFSLLIRNPYAILKLLRNSKFLRRIRGGNGPPLWVKYNMADYYEFYLDALDHPAVNNTLEYKW
ncbi:hypothetical protein BGX31_005499 [Mortierella sp. GBA43]|nr:hypothetical protein BGX31_005499 [Mortierella sp. GBA43]